MGSLAEGAVVFSAALDFLEASSWAACCANKVSSDGGSGMVVKPGISGVEWWLSDQLT